MKTLYENISRDEKTDISLTSTDKETKSINQHRLNTTEDMISTVLSIFDYVYPSSKNSPSQRLYIALPLKRLPFEIPLVLFPKEDKGLM